MPCEPCMPAWSTCLYANLPKACQHFPFTCQRANKRAKPKACQSQPSKGVSIFEIGVPTCQKACQIFNHFFLKKNIFQYIDFSIIVNVCKFQKYLVNSRKLISRKKEFKCRHFLVSYTHYKSC